MTTTKDTQDAWLQAALEYVRDQLRANATIGISANAGLKSVEIGEVPLGELVKHPEGAATAWIIPRRGTPRRTGNVIEHTVRIEINVHATAPLQPLSAFSDAQGEFRQLMSRVWNEALDLRDGGRAAGEWDDWWPDGDYDWNVIGLDDRSLLSGTLRFSFLRDVIWISVGA